MTETLDFFRNVQIFFYVATIFSLVVGWFMAGAWFLVMAFLGNSIFALQTQAAIVLLGWLWVIAGPIAPILYYKDRRRQEARQQAVSHQPESPPVRRIPADRPAFRLASIVGMDDFKAKTREAIASVKAFAEGKSKPSNGILLYGPPGCGKTMMAEAIAGDLGMDIIKVDIGKIQSRWIGQTNEQIQAAFDDAITHGNCVLFFDEVDSLLRARSSVSAGTDTEPLKNVNTMLTNTAKIHDKWHGVVFVAATNHYDLLDDTAIRDGRIDHKIEVPPPDKAARESLLTKFLAAGRSTQIAFEEGVVSRAARRWEGFSVARIKAVAERAAKMAGEEGTRRVSFNLVMRALRKVQGSYGDLLAENTMTLSELAFDPVIRSELKALATRLIDIERIESLGGSVPKGVLFHGAPGTGKTATAKALAKTAGWAFLQTSGNALLHDPESFDKLVAKAQDLRPCILFIDEADDILQDRGMSGAYGKSAANRLLQLMDGNKPLHDIMFVAATNNPEILDDAALRGGRFSEAFKFEKPSQETTLELVRCWMVEKKTTPFAPEFTPEAVVQMFAMKNLELAPADIRDRCQKAVNYAITRSDNPQVMLDDLWRVLTR